jgi:hypothetical protein
MTAPASQPPPLARVSILWSENGTVPIRAFRSLAAADAALAEAFAIEPPPEGGAYNKTAFELVWADGHKHEGRADVRQVDVETAPTGGGIIRQHLAHVGRWLRDQAATSGFATSGYWSAEDVAEKTAWGAELLRRLDAEPPLGAHRNAAGPPVARVEILWSTIEALPAVVYRSLDAAEAAIVAAARAPQSFGPPKRDQVLFRVVWADGLSHDDGVEFPRTAVPRGVLRARLREVAHVQRDVYGASKKLTEAERAQRRAWGNDMLARLAVDGPRNLHMIPEDQLLPIGTAADGLALTLLPDPLAAVAELEARFAAIRPPVKVWMGHGRTVPRTTNRDVMYAANWISLALAHDMPRLRALTGRPHGVIWDRWAKTIEHVRRHLGPDLDATYRDNPQFWSDQVEHVAHKVEKALASAPRNANAPERVQWQIRYRGPQGDLVTHQLAPDYFSALQAAATSLGFWPPVVGVRRHDGEQWRAA